MVDSEQLFFQKKVVFLVSGSEKYHFLSSLLALKNKLSVLTGQKNIINAIKICYERMYYDFTWKNLNRYD